MPRSLRESRSKAKCILGGVINCMSQKRNVLQSVERGTITSANEEIRANAFRPSMVVILLTKGLNWQSKCSF